MFTSLKLERILFSDAIPEQHARSSEQLAKIAAALKVSVSAFLEESSRPTPSSQRTLADLSEALELLGLYEAITDPEERRACLVYMRAATKRGKT